MVIKMYNDKNLDKMAQRYKDEMMRIYRDQQMKQTSVINNIPAVSKTEINGTVPINPINSSPTSIPPVMRQDTNDEINIPNGTYNYSKQIIDKAEQGFVKFPAYPSHEYTPIKPIEKTPSQTMAVPKFRSPQEIMNEAVNEVPSNQITFGQEEKTVQDVTTETANNNYLCIDMFTENNDIDMPKPPNIPVPDEVQRELDIMRSAIIPVKEPDEEIKKNDDNYNMTTPDSEIGYLQIETYVSNQAIPIEDATVIVLQKRNGNSILIKALTTDKSGKTKTISLPAPPKKYSEEKENTEVQPYATYIIRVEAQGFYPEEKLDVPIFAEVKSIQPFQLVPLPEYTPEDTQSAISCK